MHTRLHALTATIVGSLVAASPAMAQNADADRYGQGQQPQPNRPATNDTRSAAHSGPTCPVGCLPALTAAQRAARRARISREEARRREEEAFAQQQADAQRATEQELADRARVEQERIARERAESERLAQETAQREQLARENTELRSPEPGVPATTVSPISRFTSPSTTMRVWGGGPEPLSAWRPRATMAIDTQVSGYVAGLGNVTQPGPFVGLRVGIQLLSWLEFEAKGFYMYNQGVQQAVGVGVGLNGYGTSGVMRLTVPVRYIQPYWFSGIGVMHTSTNALPTSVQSTPLLWNTAGFVPIGTGVNIPITRNFQLGAEGTFNYVWDRYAFSADPAQDTRGFWQTGLLVRYVM